MTEYKVNAIAMKTDRAARRWNSFGQTAVKRHYKIFCVNGKYGIQVEFRIFYFIALQNEEDYERKESSSA